MKCTQVPSVENLTFPVREGDTGKGLRLLYRPLEAPALPGFSLYRI